MKEVFEKWIGNRVFSIRNYKESWNEVGNKPRISFNHNKAIPFHKESTCLDVSLTIGYTIFNYTNFDYNKLFRKIFK